jgi:hypothetical protein
MHKVLKRNYYFYGREWPYKNIKPGIVIEQYLVDESIGELSDYKIMCFNGEPRCSFVCSERFSETGLKVTFFDLDWNAMPFTRKYPKSEKKILRPQNYDLMLDLSRKISRNICFLRVDFYEVNGKLYIGELTFHPGSGFEKFDPPEWDEILGSWLALSENNI